MQQERSVGGTSSLKMVIKAAAQGEIERKYNMCALLMKLVNHFEG